jgi:hypothetical protein
MPARSTARRLTMALVLLGLGLGCGGDPCAKGGEVERQNCLFERVSTLFEAGDPAWRDQLATIDSPSSRDLVRLRLAVLDPQQGPAICSAVETADAKARCQQVVGRPHLASPPRPGTQGTP